MRHFLGTDSLENSEDERENGNASKGENKNEVLSEEEPIETGLNLRPEPLDLPIPIDPSSTKSSYYGNTSNIT